MKKGQSNIIGAVLLIAIVLVAGAVIFNFSSSFVEKQKQETEGFSPYYDVKLFILSELATGPGPDPEEIQLGVRREDNEGDVAGVRFIFEDNVGGSYSYDVYDYPPNEAGFVIPYEINTSKIRQGLEIKKVSVMLLYGNNKATEILDEVIVE